MRWDFNLAYGKRTVSFEARLWLDRWRYPKRSDNHVRGKWTVEKLRQRRRGKRSFDDRWGRNGTQCWDALNRCRRDFLRDDWSWSVSVHWENILDRNRRDWRGRNLMWNWCRCWSAIRSNFIWFFDFRFPKEWKVGDGLRMWRYRRWSNPCRRCDDFCRWRDPKWSHLLNRCCRNWNFGYFDRRTIATWATTTWCRTDAERLMTFCIGGEGIETSVNFSGEPAFIMETCCIGAEGIVHGMIRFSENGDIFTTWVFSFLKWTFSTILFWATCSIV